MNKQVLASEDQAAVKVLDYWSILDKPGADPHYMTKALQCRAFFVGQELSFYRE